MIKWINCLFFTSFFFSLVFSLNGDLYAYSEFQEFSQKNSGRYVSCAMCHAHPDGPEGIKPGQVGSLNKEERQFLNQARAAIQPGVDVHSPILNEFGNEIIKQVGKKEFLLLRKTPERLVDALDSNSDLDDDGISDGEEFLEGTHPLNDQHGNPLKLFKHRFWVNRFDIFIIIFATFFGLFGFNHLLHWLHYKTSSLKGRKRDEEEDDDHDDEDSYSI